MIDNKDQNQAVEGNIELKKEKKIQKSNQKIKRRRLRRKILKPEDRMKPEINDPNFQWDQNDAFVVERIIGQSTWDDEKYYLIKWKGFDITLSTWQKAEKFESMVDLIEAFRKSQKQKRDNNITETSNKLMNPYRATQVHGHFLYGDQPHEIVNTVVQFDSMGNKTIYLEVSWKNRLTQEGEMQLQNSILDSEVIFQHNPQFLLNYYQRSLQLKPQKI